MRSIAVALVGLVLGVTPAAAVDVTACGQIVPDGDTGTLQADLDCSADPADAAVALGNNATLDLNGHALVGRHIALRCPADAHQNACTIRGPGDVSGGNYGIAGANRLITVSDLTVHDVRIGGITAGRRLVLTNVSVLGSGIDGVDANQRLTATNVVVNDNAYSGIYAAQVNGTDVTANGNGYSGVGCKKCRLLRLTANGNGTEEIHVGAGGGVQGTSVRLTDSVVTGNVVDEVPVDVDTFHRPKLVNTTCDHSRRRSEPTESWGVCASD